VPSPTRRRPKPTVRLRLTLLYGFCFLLSSTALLGITYALVDTRLSHLHLSTGGSPDSLNADHALTADHAHATSTVADSLRAQRAADLHQLLVLSGVALAIMAAASVGLGWLLAGRTLRPLREITTATRTISERNLHERLALAGPDDELKDLAATIDALLARLDSAFEAQKRFVANASHELRTPLMLSKTLLQVALADPEITLDALRDVCREVLVSCDDQDELIRALLTLARSQTGLENPRLFDLAAVARTVVDTQKEEIEARGLRLHAVLNPAPAVGDPQLMEILVSNLVENAVRYNVPGGSIHITTGTARTMLTVGNTGRPVPADQVQRLLQPFQHLDRQRGHEHQGLGLGLSIVAAIADAHGADLSLRPLPGGGLDVEVRQRGMAADGTAEPGAVVARA
jgi:signal transduction histidine kinase